MEKKKIKLCFLGIGIFLLLMLFMSEIMLNIIAILGILFIVGTEMFFVFRSKVGIISKIIGVITILLLDFSFLLFILASEPGLIKGVKVELHTAILVNIISLVSVFAWAISVEKAIDKNFCKKINKEELNLENEYRFLNDSVYSLIDGERKDIVDLCNEKVIKTISNILDLSLENNNQINNVEDIKKLYDESNFPLPSQIIFKASKIINVITNSKINIGLSNILIEENYRKNRATLFCGLFAYIDNYTDNKYDYKILRKKVDYLNVAFDIDTSDNSLKQQLNITNKEETLESNNEKFNKYFKIVTKEKISINDILTPEKIEYIANFMGKYEIPFEIYVKQGKMYIKFFSNNIWRVNVKKKKISKIWFYKYYVMIKFIKEISENK